MQNKTLPIIIALVVLLVGGYFLLSKPKDVTVPPLQKNTAVGNTAPEEPATTTILPKQKHEVTCSAEGFSPAVLSIKVGDIVTFTNKSKKGFWPASNSHPVHTDYPEFDAKKEIANGKTYEFTFTKAGEWGYHNHLNPKMIGVVVVK